MTLLAPQSDTDSDLLAALAVELDAAQHEIARCHDYHSGKHPLLFATEKFREAFGGLFKTFADNWCELVCDVPRQRLRVTGFRFGDEPGDADAWRIWQRNNLDLGSLLVHNEALIAGRAYVIVWADGAGRPRITPEPARQCIVLNDPATRLPVAALKKWEIPGGGLAARLFLPDRVVSYTAQAGATVSGWRRTNTLDNPLGQVPVVEFQNKPTLLGGGRSELANVIPVQDAVNKMITDLLVASEFNSFKMRYLLVDAKSEAFDRLIAELKTKAAALQRYLVVAGGQQVGAFPETTLEGFVSAITLLTQHVATQTQTPPHYFYLRGEFPSGESIQSAEAGLVAKVEDKQVVFGEAWERVMRLAFAVQGDPRAGAEDAETIWRDPRLRPEGVVVDAAAKKFAMHGSLRQTLEDVGYSPQQQARIMAEANPPLEATVG
jgi:Phage portal protein, SPP1 Gp6-like